MTPDAIEILAWKDLYDPEKSEASITLKGVFAEAPDVSGVVNFLHRYGFREIRVTHRYDVSKV